MFLDINGEISSMKTPKIKKIFNENIFLLAISCSFYFIVLIFNAICCFIRATDSINIHFDFLELIFSNISVIAYTAF